jgi:hypothetical protein
MTDDEKAQRGQDAKAVMQNPAYLDAYHIIEQGLVSKWKDATTPDEREDCHRMLRVLAKFHSVLDSTMRSGRLAEDVLRKRQSFADKLLKRG